MVSRIGHHIAAKSAGLFWLCFFWAISSPRAADLPPIDAPPARARVVIVEDARATDAFEPKPEIVQEMLTRGLLKLAGTADLKSAWLKFVAPTDIVGIKVYSGPGPNSGTRPAVVEAVVQGLLQAGVPPTNIIIWDRRMVDLQLAGFGNLADRYNIRLASSVRAGYDENVAYTNSVLGSLVAGDLEFDRDGATTGRKSYLTKLATQTLTKIISVAPLLNHNWAGVCGHLYSVAMGTIDNSSRFEGSPIRLAQAVPEVYAIPALSDHVVLNITDALIGQYQGEEMSLLHYSTELNQIWLSKDPVALDVLAVQELEREREAHKIPSLGDNHELFENAAVMELGVDDLSEIRLDMAK
jgi:hypothetical protein